MGLRTAIPDCLLADFKSGIDAWFSDSRDVQCPAINPMGILACALV
jgi:hypothetical protein